MMEEEIELLKDALKVGDGKTVQVPAETLPSTEFVKVEKNLASLGFFTPSSKRTRNEMSKTVAVTVVIDGKRVEAKATIAPTALFGLPITADQDKWLALHRILTDIQTRDGEVKNPVSFTSAELLALLKIYRDSGKNYRDVSDWLDVMVGTTIISEGAVYVAGRRAFGKDTFHVFDRAVSFGKQLPDGSIADRNYVWLSQWQLQNINDHHQLPIDLETYRQLRNHIAKALVPLLQIWLYATRDDGVFEKRYDELCQILNVRRWNYLSKIKEKLGPSLDELKKFGYLSDWQIEKMSDKRSYKIVFYHGEKFHRDHRIRQSRKNISSGESQTLIDEQRNVPRKEKGRASHSAKPEPVSPRPTIEPQLIAEFTRRNITEKKATDLLSNLKPGQDVLAQLELIDNIIEHSRVPIDNPPGYYVRLIEANTPIPDNFETSARRNEREERERKERARRDAEEARQFLEWEYDDYCAREASRYIEANPELFETIKEAKWKKNRAAHESMSDGMITSFAEIEAKQEMKKQLPLPTFEEYVTQKRNGTLSSVTAVAEPPAPDVEREPWPTDSSGIEISTDEKQSSEPIPNRSLLLIPEPVAQLASAKILPEILPLQMTNAIAVAADHGETQPPLIVSTAANDEPLSHESAIVQDDVYVTPSTSQILGPDSQRPGGVTEPLDQSQTQDSDPTTPAL
jgi:hypothetical protein